MYKDFPLKVLLVGVISLFTASFVPPVEAKEVCFRQYGGGETCVEVEEKPELKVDKTVWNPSSGEYEDHVKISTGSNPYKFRAEETIKFKIVVKNTGEVKIKNIELKDILPTFVRYRSGSGSSRKDGAEVVFDKFDLDSGEEKEFEFVAEVANDGILPNDDKLCLTNIAKAEGVRENNDSNKESDVDYANFCIGLPKVLGKEAPTQLPITGRDYTEVLLGFVAVGFILMGYGFKKLAG